MEESTHVEAHPLIFTIRDAISGRGFLAGVTVRGKGIMLHEFGEWWFYGVRPGAIAACGATPSEAFGAFRTRFLETMFDFAEEADSFSKFRERAEAFYHQPEPAQEELWEGALALVRERDRRGGKLPSAFTGLPRMRPEQHPSQIEVVHLSRHAPRFMPSDNVADFQAVAA